MKVIQVAIRPTEASDAAGRPALTPELLAASGARYSRNNEGLEAILAKIDPLQLDRSVDSIFKMIDYGHQSIADMVPVAMFIDNISLWLAYYLWTLCPTAGGQESSTRYIRMSLDGLIPSEALGIGKESKTANSAKNGVSEWRQTMEGCFAAYHSALEIWEGIAEAAPEVARIPHNLLDDPSDRATRQVARMRRNYGFDRARYFLPVAAATNVMMVMSARGWVQLCQALLSHPLPEAGQLGTLIQQELRLCAPRLMRHATAKPSFVEGLAVEFAQWQRMAQNEIATLAPDATDYEHPVGPALDIMLPADIRSSDIAHDLRFHDNRYAWMGPDLRRTAVRFQWDAVAFAEIRDLNRHRTGTRTCPLVPQGFYAALDQVPAWQRNRLEELARMGQKASRYARELLQAGDPHYIYWTLLGTQYPFEHVTTADKFLYEAELRTGTGAHYRYADHMHDVLALWYERFPETRGLVLEGSAEPE